MAEVLYNLLKHESIDSSLAHGLQPYMSFFSFAWRFTDKPYDDYWTKELNSYKTNDPLTVKRASIIIPEILIENYSSICCKRPSEIVIVSAIPSSQNIIKNNHPSYHLGVSIAKTLNCEWKPTILSKITHSPLHTLKNAFKRDNEVKGKYISDLIPKGINEIIIIDDFLTRGSTFCAIAKSIIDINKRMYKFICFAMGKTEKHNYILTTYGHDLNNLHIQKDIMKQWEAIK